MSVQGFLQATSRELDVLRRLKQRLSAEVALDFSVFEMLRLDEMDLSACLGCLLDPAAKHGQGDAYLNLFLRRLELPGEWSGNFGAPTVTLEKQAHGQRRIDVFLRWPDFRAIGIENKPWAGDQSQQLTDYARYVREAAAGAPWAIVYLADRPPDESSISSEEVALLQAAGNYRALSYKGCAEWLADCARATKPDRVRIFLWDLERFVREQVMGEVDMSDFEAINTVALASNENLEAALLVGRSVEQLKRSLLTGGLQAPYAAQVSAWGATLVWEKMDVIAISAGFGAAPPRFPNAQIRFEFEFAGLRRLFWGIKRVQPAKTSALSDQEQAIHVAISQQFGPGKSSPWWIWWSSDCEGLGARDWYDNEQPWLEMRAGPAAAERFAQRTHLVLQALEKVVL